MKVMIAQCRFTIGAMKENADRILHILREAKKKGVDLILFSEMALCGYAPNELLFYQQFIEEVNREGKRVAQASHGLALFLGIVRRNVQAEGEPLHNSVAIIQNGQLRGFQDKCIPTNNTLCDETLYFKAGQQVNSWKVGEMRIGVLIGEDVGLNHAQNDHFHPHPLLELAEHRIDLCLVPSAFPYQMNAFERRVKVGKRAAKILNCPLIICNQVGGHGSTIFDGYSMHFNAKGRLTHLAPGFREECMVIDLEQQRETRLSFAHSEMADLCNALVLGTRDYALKNGFSHLCLGVSGGVDSALVAYIATKAMGKNRVTGVEMPSQYTPQRSQEESAQLIRSLGISSWNFPIQSIVDHILHILAPLSIDRKTNHTEENIQARVRGLLLMALSNQYHYLLLNTGNKNELSVGYVTLYGDMCGGLSVIGDLTKTQVYALCRYINSGEPSPIIPPSILEKMPSAELLPSQTDLDTLPDYQTLGSILEGYLEKHLSSEEIVQHYHLPCEVVAQVVHRIIQSEFKKRQSVPTLHVSSNPLGSKHHYPLMHRWGWEEK